MWVTLCTQYVVGMGRSTSPTPSLQPKHNYKNNSNKTNNVQVLVYEMSRIWVSTGRHIFLTPLEGYVDVFFIISVDFLLFIKRTLYPWFNILRLFCTVFIESLSGRTETIDCIESSGRLLQIHR